MKIGVPKEVTNPEYRVAITPIGVHELTAHGHDVYVEKNAGVGSQIDDVEPLAPKLRANWERRTAGSPKLPSMVVPVAAGLRSSPRPPHECSICGHSSPDGFTSLPVPGTHLTVYGAGGAAMTPTTI